MDTMPTQEPVAKLDSEEMVELHKELMDKYRRELGRQYENRMEQAIDEDYYDSIQWSEEDAKILRERGQAPMVYNVIAQSVNWVIGSEKRGRTDFKILPRMKEDTKPAERKTQVLKYLSDVNHTPFHRSRAFEDVVKVGIGWLEDGIQDGDEKELIYSRYESWRNMLFDSSSTELGLQDARYVFRTKWVDEDVAKAMFPERTGTIEAASQDNSGMTTSFDEYSDEAMDSMETENNLGIGISSSYGTRRRVRLIEAWFRKPVSVQIVNGGTFHGKEFDKEDLAMAEEIEAGFAKIKKRMRMRMHVAVMTTEGMLYHSRSPYNHNEFPFTPIWGFRRGRDGMPYGIIRSVRDIQDDINKRASKAQFILATNKTIMDDGAVPDMDEFLEQVSRPDGVIIKKAGKDLQINVDRELAPAHIEMMTRSIGMIQQVSGVTDELMGRTTNAVSGAAITARQEQGALSTSKLFDNLRLSYQLQGEKQLSLVEQYFTDEKKLRIVNSRGTPEFISVNDGLPENDIVRSKADFVISESDWRSTIRQANAEQLMEMMGRMPGDIAITLLDLVVESMDIPNRDELVARIRKVNGQQDPDIDPETPEAQEFAQAMAAQQQAQQQAMMIEQGKAEASIELDRARAAKYVAEVGYLQRRAIGESVSQQAKAIDAATKVVQTPTAAEAADILLQESGFIGASEAYDAQLMMQEQVAEQQAMQQQME